MNRIRELREKKGFSQTMFAGELGVTQQAVASWETGTSDPAWEKAPKMADILSCTIDALFGREPSSEPAS